MLPYLEKVCGLGNPVTVIYCGGTATTFLFMSIVRDPSWLDIFPMVIAEAETLVVVVLCSQGDNVPG